jgi:glycerophosphoryl diester phosphodiesterase
MHDGTVDRTTNGTGDVGAMTLADLRQLDAGAWFSPSFSGELVPLMSEAVLATLPDMKPFIERKTGPAALYVDLIRALRIENEAVVIAFDWDFLAEVETLLPAIRTGALGSEALTLADIQGIESRGIDFIDWAHSTVTAETVDLVHAFGMELHVWTVDDAARMQTLIDSGIDGITTNEPQLARELLLAQ